MEYGMPYLCNGATLYYVQWIIIYYSDCKSIRCKCCDDTRRVFEIVRTDRIATYDKMVYSINCTNANCTNTVTFEIRGIRYRQNDRVVENNSVFCKRDQFDVTARLVSATIVLIMDNTKKTSL